MQHDPDVRPVHLLSKQPIIETKILQLGRCILTLKQGPEPRFRVSLEDSRDLVVLVHRR